MAQKDVKISFSGTTISVDKDKISAKKNEDTVEWSGDEQFTIKNLPGGDVTSRASGGKWLASAGPFTTVGIIKYDVAATGYETLDPEIDVQP